jgi:Methyltransferase domain
MDMTPLCELARKYGTDKGGDHLQAGDTCHNYTPFYHEMFKDRRNDVTAVLEIGISHGCSLRMWKEYFSKATIFGIDSNPECLFEEDRIHTFAADQHAERDLLEIMDHLKRQRFERANGFDLIIDDGSHEPAHQVFTAQVLLPYLGIDGIYVIEDIEPDCRPQLIGDSIVQWEPKAPIPTKELHYKLINHWYRWQAIPTGRGLGRAYCRCGCEGGEQLVVIRHV